MVNIKKLTRISIIKTLRFNLRYFGIRGFTFPVIVGRNFILSSMNGTVHIDSFKTGNIWLGLSDINFYDGRSIRGVWRNEGKINLRHDNCVYVGAKIYNQGELDFGCNNRFAQVKIWCRKKITFGDNCLVAWDTIFLDSDHHGIFNNKNEKINSDEEIVIGNNVWIGCNCMVLKGVKVADGCIIGAGSIVSKALDRDHAIYLGVNRMVRENVRWTWDN